MWYCLLKLANVNSLELDIDWAQEIVVNIVWVLSTNIMRLCFKWNTWSNTCISSIFYLDGLNKACIGCIYLSIFIELCGIKISTYLYCRSGINQTYKVEYLWVERRIKLYVSHLQFHQNLFTKVNYVTFRLYISLCIQVVPILCDMAHIR